MDEIEITIYKEIKDFKERYLIFTFREWVTIALVAVINIPLFLYGRQYLGEETASNIVCVIAVIIGGIGLGKVNGMNIEYIYKFIFRQLFFLRRPLKYKTDEMIKEEERIKDENKKNKRKKRRSGGK